jgi:exopolysaccharide production protein ExoQ
MTLAAYGAGRGEPARLTFPELAMFGGAVLILLIYSQGWLLGLTGGTDAPTDAGIVRDVFFPAYGLAIVGLAMAPGDILKALLRQPFLLLLMAVVVASIFWSIAPGPTERRVFAVSLTTLGAVVIGARYRWAQLAEIFAATFGVLVAVSVVAAVLFPSIGRMTELFPGAWRGLWPEKNALGGNMALGFVMAAAAAILNPRRAWLWSGVAVGALFLVLMSTSKTSLVALMLGAAALGFVWMVKRGPAWAVMASWMALAGIGALAAFIMLDSAAFFAILGKDATLTGRTQIWAGVMRQIQLRPWQGYGYFAVWDDASGWGPLAWIAHDARFTPHHAHNSWLEQWLGMGIFGLTAWALFYLQTVTTAIVSVYRHPGAYLAFPFLVVYSLTTLTESVAVTYNDMRWVIFVCLAVRLALPQQAPNAPQPTRRAPSATVTTLHPAFNASAANRSRT